MWEYKPVIPEEYQDRYCPGGLHPTLLGDTFKDGRYKILHKLGTGGFSTIWAARDLKESKYVALKITVAKPEETAREITTLLKLVQLQTQGVSSKHVVSLLDHFEHKGPNGTHNCLVLEMVGRSVRELGMRRYGGEDFPATIAKSFAKQVLEGLKFLHENNITHGDLHTGNLAVSIPNIHSLSKKQFMKKMEKPRIFKVIRRDGQPLPENVPIYQVSMTHWPLERSIRPLPTIKIIDFDQSFTPESRPNTLSNPTYLKAPEVVLKEKFDHRVDLWAMGCLLFELHTGNPPFDSWGVTPRSYLEEVCELLGEEIPQRWQSAWGDIKSEFPGRKSNPKYTLESWLERRYFSHYGGNEDEDSEDEDSEDEDNEDKDNEDKDNEDKEEDRKDKEEDREDKDNEDEDVNQEEEDGEGEEQFKKDEEVEYYDPERAEEWMDYRFRDEWKDGYDWKPEDRLDLDDIQKLAKLIRKMLRIDPEERMEAAELLKDEWWNE